MAVDEQPQATERRAAVATGDDVLVSVVDAGRAAADRLAHSWPDRSWIADVTDAEWARAAIDRFGELFREQPAIFRASRAGTEVGAESLSIRPYQGILEVLQNADDTHATELRIHVLRDRQPVLLLGHDGDPVDLGQAAAMCLPWLTTKDDDADASGRFGIGQQTLRALGGPIEVHCPPFHFRLTEDGPEWTDAAEDVQDVYDSSRRETLVKVPLHDAVNPSELMEFAAELSGRTLLFLRSVRSLVATDEDDPSLRVRHSLAVDATADVPIKIRSHNVTAAWTRLRDEQTGEIHFTYTTSVPVPATQRRRHKAAGPTTAIGVGVSETVLGPGRFYDRLPMPVALPFPFSVNAQFDPDAARSGLLEVAWNEHRLADLAELTATAAADAAARTPAAAWRFVPLKADYEPGGPSWLGTQLDALISGAQARFAADVRVQTHDGRHPLPELVYEAPSLTGVLSTGDQQRLEPGCWAIDSAARDDSGRWRVVLDELAQSRLIEVERALEIFELEDEDFGPRDPEWFVGMALAAVESDLLEELLWKRSILLADGSRVEPPGSQDPRTLVWQAASTSIGVLLGVTLPVHPVYGSDGAGARAVFAALRDAEVMLPDGDSPEATFTVLARAVAEDGLPPVRLEDGQLLALRDAFESIDDERQRDLGPRIGRNIELRAFSYGKGGRTEGWKRPTDTYLPSAIDRETGSFARAAASTPGLWWLDGRYAQLLRRLGGRRELGAQRFLVKLGAATQPRLMRPANEVVPWRRDTRPASPIGGIDRSPTQLREINAADGYRRTHLLDDRWSPDLEAVTADIARDRNVARRRARGLALLAVLSRSWERHYADHQTAKAVYGSDGYWQRPVDVIATWLSSAAEAPWMPSQSGRARPPIELALGTEANRLAYGNDRTRFLASVDDAIARGPAVAALRMRRAPAVSGLIRRLRELAAVPVTPETGAEARTIYVLLSLACRESNSTTIDDMTLAEFRGAFRRTGRGSGLLLVGDEWVGITDVLAGPPVFGSYRRFVPNAPGLESLWRTIGIREPDALECLAVLREVAEAPLRPADTAVVLQTLRTLDGLLAGASPQVRGQLARLPLWTGSRWVRSRPVFATEDPSIASEINAQVPTWAHPFTSFVGLGLLLDALRVTVVRRDQFEAEGLTAAGKAAGDPLRPRLASAVGHMHDEFARGDQALFASLTVTWDSLRKMELLVDDGLRLTYRPEGGRSLSIAAEAHVVRDPVVLAVRRIELVGDADTAGRAIASLFDGDRQKVAWAWASMWQRAEAREPSSGLRLAEEDVAADHTARLLNLRDQAASRRQRPSTASKAAAGQRQTKAGGVEVRQLKDIATLAPAEGTIVNAGVTKPGIAFPTPVTVSRPEPSPAGSAPVGGAPPPAGGDGAAPARPIQRRSVLPPMTEREQLAFDAVQTALALDPPEIQDLRARRGIGADALDDLRQLYEIKMFTGALGNDVTLLKSEVAAAQDPDFFLAVVAGLEDGDVPLSVRFIRDPLHSLTQRITGDVALTGIRDVEALEYVFDKAPVAAPPEARIWTEDELATRRVAFMEAIESIRAGRPANHPDTGKPIVALSKDHAIRALKADLKREPAGA
jgi:hypothetical protein